VHWTPKGLFGSVKELLMSEQQKGMSDRQTKKLPPLAFRKGGVRKGCARTGKVIAVAPSSPAQDEDCDVR
jgi:hypothetical protein